MPIATPTVPAAMRARLVPKPMSLKKDWRSGLSLAQTGPFEKPSKDVVPIATHRSAALPGTTGQGGAPDNGGRTYTVWSRRSKIARRENRLKYTPNAAARPDH